jgi:hypothetical protein
MGQRAKAAVQVLPEHFVYQRAKAAVQVLPEHFVHCCAVSAPKEARFNEARLDGASAARSGASRLYVSRSLNNGSIIFYRRCRTSEGFSEEKAGNMVF